MFHMRKVKFPVHNTTRGIQISCIVS
uniref:Uncharacterized protein n=1 Tax=Lepeophtheirus salmonis TaxID=72036 RepID=A0A0K2VKM4_LEPSM